MENTKPREKLLTTTAAINTTTNKQKSKKQFFEKIDEKLKLFWIIVYYSQK